LLDELEGVIENGERGEAEEVHLQQAKLFDGAHVEGGDDFVVLGAVERDEFGEGLGGDDDPGGVYAGIPHQAFELPGGVEELADLRVGLVGLGQLRRILQRLVQRNIQDCGISLRCGRHRHRACPWRGDALIAALACMVPKVMIWATLSRPTYCDVVDDFGTAVHAEVDVDIGHGDAFRIQKPLEQQFVL